MHDRSQVQGSGNGRDVAPLANKREKPEHCCRLCNRNFKSKPWLTKHESKCDGIFKRTQRNYEGVESIDFVKCKLCNIKARTLGKHLTQVHALTNYQYLETFPEALLTCTKSAEIFKLRGKNFAWLQRAKERGDDLSAYRKKVGDSVREVIMNNPSERKRRSELSKETITKWATSDEGRKIASETAKKTSSRPEILERRSKALADWREREPNVFYEKCTRSMHSFRTSKPEKWIRDYVQSRFPDLGFKGNQQLRSNAHFLINKSHIRQIDILSKSHKIIIEVDGYLHFNNVPQWNQLENVEKKDKELNDAVKSMGYMLVRISHSQWNHDGKLSDDAHELLDMCLQFPSPGVNFIGPEYEKIKMTYTNNEQRFERTLLDVAENLNISVTKLYNLLGDKNE